MKENKPKGSPNIKNWLDDGGTITIEELGNDKYIWHYSKDGITVPYVPKEINGVTQNVVQFPDEFIYQREGFEGKFQIPEGFSGNRNEDKQNALLYLKNEYRINRIPNGYVLHHDINNGWFQLVKEDIHDIFKHYGGHYYDK